MMIWNPAYTLLVEARGRRFRVGQCHEQLSNRQARRRGTKYST